MSNSVWQVVYQIHTPIPFQGGSLSFTAEGVDLREREGALFRIEHTLRLPESASIDDALHTSRDKLDALLMAIRFVRVLPFEWSSDAKRLEPPGPNLLAFGFRATVVLGPRPLVVPSQGWNEQDADRLGAMLTFASEAQESSSPATAVRLYYLVIEDLIDQGAVAANAQFVADLRAVRNFASHAKIDQKWTENRLRSCAPELTIEPDAFRYRPANPIHRAILAQFRDRARALVDQELFKRLGVPHQ
jgi:hypothetical protein